MKGMNTKGGYRVDMGSVLLLLDHVPQGGQGGFVDGGGEEDGPGQGDGEENGGQGHPPTNPPILAPTQGHPHLLVVKLMILSVPLS